MSTPEIKRTEKRKSRLSRLLGAGSRKREEDMTQQERVESDSINDSAYGSEFGAPTREDIGSFDNHGQIPGVSADRPLVLDKKTGEVVDEETGDIIITTTTTTTTTTRMNGKNKVVEVHTETSAPQHQSHGQGHSPNGTPIVTPSVGSETNYNNSNNNISSNNSNTTPNQFQQPDAKNLQYPNQNQTHLQPPVELSAAAGISQPTTPAHEVPSPLFSHAQQREGSPAIPTRNPNRSSPGLSPNPNHSPNLNHASSGKFETPVSPIDADHPQSFTNPNDRPGAPPSGSSGRLSGGSLASLKAAAIGLHGVGETLRGTLNDTLDRRIPRSDAERAAATNAKNQETLERGKSQMGGLEAFNSFRRSMRREN